MKTMTEDAIVKRINRALCHEDEQLHKARRDIERIEFGDWYIRNWRQTNIVATHVDPEDLARELGVL